MRLTGLVRPGKSLVALSLERRGGKGRPSRLNVSEPLTGEEEGEPPSTPPASSPSLG
jgi:hypothetical protein